MQLARPLLLVLLAPAAGPVDLAFAPEAGSAATKRFVCTSVLTADSLDFAIGDRNVQFPTGMRSTRTVDLTVTDTFEEVGEGRPLVLVRRYDEVHGEWEHTDVPETLIVSGDGERTGLVEGHTVRFAWDAAEEDYVASFVDEEDETDDAWLEDLAEDLDLRAFLPGRAASEGDAWKLDPAALYAVLRPGGKFAWDDDEEEDDPDGDGLRIVLPGIAPEDLFDELGGEAKATFVAQSDDTATVKVELELEGEADLVERFTDLLGTDGDTTRVFDEAEATVRLAGEGELVWDLVRGTLVSFEFDADLETSMDATWTHSRIEDGEAELTLYEEESGTFALRVERVD